MYGNYSTGHFRRLHRQSGAVAGANRNGINTLRAAAADYCCNPFSTLT